MEIIDKIDEWGQRHWKFVTRVLLIAMLAIMATCGGLE